MRHSDKELEAKCRHFDDFDYFSREAFGSNGELIHYGRDHKRAYEQLEKFRSAPVTLFILNDAKTGLPEQFLLMYHSN